MSTDVLYNHKKIKSKRLVDRYLGFISSRGSAQHSFVEMHHIVPKAVDFHPEFKSFKDHPWNCVKLSPREHFIAHWMLAKAFPGSSQTRAFYYMCNKVGNKRSRTYADGRAEHILNMKNTLYTGDRNDKISRALKNKPKSKAHKDKLMGHEVSLETREKISRSLKGRTTHSESSRAMMSLKRRGVKMGPMSETQKQIISKTKKSQCKKWFNDGVVNKMYSVNDVPLGWVLGRLPWQQK